VIGDYFTVKRYINEDCPKIKNFQGKKKKMLTVGISRRQGKEVFSLQPTASGLLPLSRRRFGMVTTICRMRHFPQDLVSDKLSERLHPFLVATRTEVSLLATEGDTRRFHFP
jgi:hypothetical protein